jgi:hypothetical protein
MKSEHASSTQQNGFGLAFLQSLLRLVKVTTKPPTTPAREE